jgi:hypothetical protein
MDTAVVKFGAASLALGLFAFVVLLAVWGGLGPCTDISQVVFLVLALGGILIGCAVLLVSLPGVLVRRYKEHRVGGVGSLFAKSDKKSDHF